MRLLYIIFILLGLISCHRQEEFNNVRNSGSDLYTQIEEVPSTKSSLNETNNVLWSERDELTVFNKSTLPQKYRIQDEFVGKNYGYFSPVETESAGDEIGSGMALGHIIAYYPYADGVGCQSSEDAYRLSGVMLPSEQTYAKNSFGQGTFPMVAVSQDNNITFRNVCGGIKLLLKGTQAVASIRIEGNDNEKLAGAATVTAYTDGSDPAIELSGNASTYATLTCSEAVQLNESTATEFIIALPPTVFSQGFTVTVTDIDNKSYTFSSDKKNSILRSSMLVMPEVSLNVSDKKVVDLFIFMGQSNMVGRGIASKAPEVPEGWGYEYKAISQPDRLLPVIEPFGMNEENVQSGVTDNRRSGSLVSAFMNAYYRATQIPVVGVSCSKGGTTVAFWQPDGKPLNDAISRYDQAEKWLLDNGYEIRKKYMLWLQGETDAYNGLSAEDYRAGLIKIVKEMVSRTSVEKCMLIRVGKLGQEVSSAITICDDIIEEQTDLCKTYKEFVMASTAAAGFVEEGLMAEYWHYTQEGYNLLGTYAGENVAYYAMNGLEPSMFDPHYKSQYTPVAKTRSVLDYKDEAGVPEYDFSHTTWYINHIENGAKFTSVCVKGGRGWAISDNNKAYEQIVGRPINTAAFFTNKKSQTVTVTKVPYKGATSGEIIATVTATIPSANKHLAVITFPTVTLEEGEYLSLFSQEDDDIHFYYSTTTVNDANNVRDAGFYSRLPILYGSGTSWSEVAMSLGWSFGYTSVPEVSSIACIGNSITYGVGASNQGHRYSTLLAKLLNADEINLGVSGTSLCTDGSRKCNFEKLTAENLAGAGIVTIKMGINDWAAAKPEFYSLGTLGSDDTSTIYGAMRMWCEKITELKNSGQYKNTKFYFITPLITSWNSSVTSIKDYDQSKKNIHGFTLRDLCDAIIQTCSTYDIPVLDMNKHSGIYYNSLDDSNASLYFDDGVHPNDAGHAKLAQALYDALIEDAIRETLNK